MISLEVLQNLVKCTKEKILLNYILESCVTKTTKNINIYYTYESNGSSIRGISDLIYFYEHPTYITTRNIRDDLNTIISRIPNNSIMIVNEKYSYLRTASKQEAKANGYQVVQPTDTKRTPDDYWRYIDNKNLHPIIKLNQFAFFFLDKQVLYIFPQAYEKFQEDTNQVYEYDLLEKATLLFTNLTSTEFGGKQELIRLMNLNPNEILASYNDVQLDGLMIELSNRLKQDINDKIVNSEATLQSYLLKYSEELKNLNNLKLKLFTNFEIQIKTIQNALIKELKQNDLIESVESKINIDRKTMNIYAKTKNIPQNFLDTTTLERIKDNLIYNNYGNNVASANSMYKKQDLKEHIENLINFKEQLILGGTIIKFRINLNELLTNPISIYFKKDAYAEPPQNRHIHYGDADYTEANYYAGCQGGFRTIFLNTIAQIPNDPNMIKKLVIAVLQYLQTTNPADVAGQRNILNGKYMEIKEC